MANPPFLDDPSILQVNGTTTDSLNYRETAPIEPGNVLSMLLDSAIAKAARESTPDGERPSLSSNASRNSINTTIPTKLSESPNQGHEFTDSVAVSTPSATDLSSLDEVNITDFSNFNLPSDSTTPSDKIIYSIDYLLYLNSLPLVDPKLVQLPERSFWRLHLKKMMPKDAPTKQNRRKKDRDQRNDKQGFDRGAPPGLKRNGFFGSEDKPYPIADEDNEEIPDWGDANGGDLDLALLSSAAHSDLMNMQTVEDFEKWKQQMRKDKPKESSEEAASEHNDVDSFFSFVKAPTLSVKPGNTGDAKLSRFSSFFGGPGPEEKLKFFKGDAKQIQTSSQQQSSSQLPNNLPNQLANHHHNQSPSHPQGQLHNQPQNLQIQGQQTPQHPQFSQPTQILGNMRSPPGVNVPNQAKASPNLPNKSVLAAQNVPEAQNSARQSSQIPQAQKLANINSVQSGTVQVPRFDPQNGPMQRQMPPHMMSGGNGPQQHPGMPPPGHLPPGFPMNPQVTNDSFFRSLMAKPDDQTKGGIPPWIAQQYAQGLPQMPQKRHVQGQGQDQSQFQGQLPAKEGPIPGIAPRGQPNMHQNPMHDPRSQFFGPPGMVPQFIPPGMIPPQFHNQQGQQGQQGQLPHGQHGQQGIGRSDQNNMRASGPYIFGNQNPNGPNNPNVRTNPSNGQHPNIYPVQGQQYR